MNTKTTFAKKAAAEDYLLANAPKVYIGAPKALVKERVIRLG